MPPGGSKDHRPKCGLARGLGYASEARNWGSAIADFLPRNRRPGFSAPAVSL